MKAYLEELETDTKKKVLGGGGLSLTRHSLVDKAVAQQCMQTAALRVRIFSLVRKGSIIMR